MYTASCSEQKLLLLHNHTWKYFKSTMSFLEPFTFPGLVEGQSNLTVLFVYRIHMVANIAHTLLERIKV